MRVVVLDQRSDPHSAEVTESIAAALERGADDALQAADVAVVLDSSSLESAREAGARVVVAVVAGFELVFGAELANADRVIVAHQSLVPLVVRRGVPKDRVGVAAPVAPRGFAPAADRVALRQELGVPDDMPLVLVPAAAFDEHGAESLFVQLALVRDGVGFLFDVGGDAEAAAAVRRLVPSHGIDAWMFADDAATARHYQLADVALVRARGYEVARALAVGAPLVVLPASRSDVATVSALEAAGVGNDAEVIATLAVAIDRALDPDAQREGRRAVAALEVAGGAAKVADQVETAWRESRAQVAGAPRRGLPQGLERISREIVAPTAAPASKSEIDAIEARIDSELAALKQKLREGG